MALGRILVPSNARRGQVLEVRVLIQHPMETGFRFDVMGTPIPKNVVNTVVCRYNGVEVLRAELGPGVAANPYLQFHARVEASGAFEVEWVDDAGERGTEKAAITVS
jgi:sulfur-oxidizing protein SoxZ